jgi:hypothetical protein
VFEYATNVARKHGSHKNKTDVPVFQLIDRFWRGVSRANLTRIKTNITFDQSHWMPQNSFVWDDAGGVQCNCVVPFELFFSNTWPQLHIKAKNINKNRFPAQPTDDRNLPNMLPVMADTANFRLDSILWEAITSMWANAMHETNGRMACMQPTQLPQLWHKKTGRLTSAASTTLPNCNNNNPNCTV